MSITATVENGTLKLPPGIELPDGTSVEIIVLETPADSLPLGYLERVAGALAGEPFERPAQGDFEPRAPW